MSLVHKHFQTKTTKRSREATNYNIILALFYQSYRLFIWHVFCFYMAFAFTLCDCILNYLTKNTLFTRQISAIRFNQQNEYIQKVSFNISIS